MVYVYNELIEWRLYTDNKLQIMEHDFTVNDTVMRGLIVLMQGKIKQIADIFIRDKGVSDYSGFVTVALLKGVYNLSKETIETPIIFNDTLEDTNILQAIDGVSIILNIPCANAFKK